MAAPPEQDEPFAPASPIRLGEPYLGPQAGLQATRLVLRFTWRIIKDSAPPAWKRFKRQGWPVGLIVGVLFAIGEGKIVPAVIWGAIIAVAILLLVFFGHFLMGPLRLVEEERRRLRREARSLETVAEPPGRSVQLPFPDSAYSYEPPGGEPVILRPLPDDEEKVR
jgi:hypothetical protein